MTCYTAEPSAVGKDVGVLSVRTVEERSQIGVWVFVTQRKEIYMSSAITVDGGQDSMTLTEQATDYIAERGLDVETAINLGVYTSSQHGTEVIALPYLRDGKTVNHKYKNYLGASNFPSWSQDKGGEKVVWNRDVLLDDSIQHLPVIITEGEWDCIAAVQCGFVRSISVPDGAPSKSIEPERDSVSHKYSYIRDIVELLEDCKEIILCTDGDTNGQVLRDDLAIRLGKTRCKFVSYPKNCKDLNDALKLYGEKGVTETIARAKWFPVDGVYRFDELPEINERPVYNLGMGSLDYHFKLRRGDFTVVTGVPSSGKSTFLNHMMCKLVKNHDMRVCFASFEQAPQTDHLRALRKWWFWEYKNKIAPTHVKYMDESDTTEFNDWLDRHFRVIYPSWEDSVDINWLLEKMSASVVQQDCDVIIIDPFNEMEHNTEGESMTIYIGWFIKNLKRFASKHNVHIVVVAHPRKINKDKDGNVEIPTLYDIEQSAMWYNKADLGMIIHRNNSITAARVAKSRYEDVIGKRGQVLYTYDEETAHFHEYEEV